MPRKQSTSHPRVPPELAPVLRSFVEQHGEPERWARTEIDRPWVVLSADAVGYLSYNDPSTARLDREASRLRWASGAGIPVPNILESSANMFVTERVRHHQPRGRRYLELAIDAAQRIESAEPPQLGSGAGQRTSHRRTRPQRALRALAGRLDPRAFIEARNAAALLPRDALSHGDFHPNNVLFDPGSDRVAVIDWSYLGLQPRGTDLAYLWTQLEAPEDRAVLVDRLISNAPDTRRLAVLLRWLAFRSFVETITDRPWRQRDPIKIDGARLVMREAEDVAKRIDGMAATG